MSQELIDFGAFPDDGAADAIRIAFQKSQNNFTELYQTISNSGVLTLTVGAGLSQDETVGNVNITANISSVTVRTGANLLVGVGAATSNYAQITSAGTPFVFDLAPNITVSNISATDGITGILKTAAQPNVTSLGNLTSLQVDGNANATYFNGDVVANNIQGTHISAPGSNTQVIYNSAGLLGASANMTFNGSVLTITGNVTATNKVTAAYLAGDGSNITNLPGSTVSGWVANANYANYAGNIVAANAGAVLYQYAANVTRSTATGTAGQILISAGTSAPYWAYPNTISAGTELLTAGDYLTGGSFSGAVAKTFAVDASSVATANKVVVWDNNGSLHANKLYGNLSVGGNTGEIFFNSSSNLAVDPNLKFISQTLYSPNFSGNYVAPGSNTQVMFNDNGFINASANFTFNKTTNTVSATKFAGDGSLLTNVPGSVINSVVSRANLANAIVGGNAGEILYQSAANVTSFLPAGSMNYALLGNGVGQPPKWVNSTISGIPLGNSLATLSNGSWITGGSYNGSTPITFTVDGTIGASGNKVAVRDNSGNLYGNLTSGVTLSATGGATSTSTGTGALTVNGGAGISGNVYVGQTIYGNLSGNVTGNVTGTWGNFDSVKTTNLTTGASGTVGTITGNWVLSAGSRVGATYSDLAEYYCGDAKYEPGTVLDFGGTHEVTLSNTYMSSRVAGVVTTEPAYVMNSNITCEFPIAIALQGRVPCKITGNVNKGDLMVSAGNGYAVACNKPSFGTLIGKSLENFYGKDGVIEVAVGRL